MRFESTVIVRRDDRVLPASDGVVDIAGAPDCVYAALVDRTGGWVTRGLVDSLFSGLDGLATIYNSIGQLLVLGRDPRSIAAAAGEVVRLGGGMASASGARVEWSAPLTICGISADLPYAGSVESERALARRAAAAGYPFHDVLYTLLFLRATSCRSCGSRRAACSRSRPERCSSRPWRSPRGPPVR